MNQLNKATITIDNALQYHWRVPHIKRKYRDLSCLKWLHSITIHILSWSHGQGHGRWEWFRLKFNLITVHLFSVLKLSFCHCVHESMLTRLHQRNSQTKIHDLLRHYRTKCGYVTLMSLPSWKIKTLCHVNLTHCANRALKRSYHRVSQDWYILWPIYKIMLVFLFCVFFGDLYFI